MSMDRDDTHTQFSDMLNHLIMPDAELKKLKGKLLKMFDSKHHETTGEIQRLEAVSANVRQAITNQIKALANPSNAFIADEIREEIEKLKTELANNQEKIDLLADQHQSDLGEFLEFAFNFLSNKGRHFFELNGTDMKRCKQMLFTGKIYVDADKKVYTHDTSPIFRYESNKKDLSETEKSFMVRVKRL